MNEYDSPVRQSYRKPDIECQHQHQQTALRKIEDLEDEDEYEYGVVVPLYHGERYTSPAACFFNLAPYSYGGWNSTDSSTFPAAPPAARMKNFTFGM